MPERGGATTQSGIYYQNAAAALYLARLCDSRDRSKSDQIIRVRFEEPTHVDDIVVSFTDGHREYIQAKESIRIGDAVWRELWQDFASQFLMPDFQRNKDSLLLHTGDTSKNHEALQSFCSKARHSLTLEEWQNRLTKAERQLIDKIKPNIKPELLNETDFKEFFSHIEVEIWPLKYIERDLAPIWVPQSNVPSTALYGFLHNLAGGRARVRGNFTAETLRITLDNKHIQLNTPPNINSLCLSIQQCSSLLHKYKTSIGKTGYHIRRDIVNEIVNWACTVTGDKCISMLLDRAGMGKTVVMSDVLKELEAREITCLAIKADQQLSGSTSMEGIQQRLNLPDTPEKVIAQIATLKRVVVLVDQIDALSLSLTHDQNTLNTVLDLITRLSRIPSVSIVISCRTFDRDSDPRLRNLETATEYHLSEFSYLEVEKVLETINIPFDELLPSLQKLLCIPLHLELFVRSFENNPQIKDISRFSGITSLQDLYDHLWRNVILRPLDKGPSTGEREKVLYLLTDQMYKKQRTDVSRILFSKQENCYLEQAVTWLASEGIIISNDREWGFLHQTFFDYCYAKRFIENSTSLVEAILASDQSLFTRPLIVQVLGYLRGRDQHRYLQELQGLLNAGYAQSSKLRFHLRDLLIRWFGALIDPTEDEWVIARRLLLNPSHRPNVLGAMQGNPCVRGAAAPKRRTLQYLI